MKEYVKQHIVPQRYLQRFGSKGNKKDRFVIGVRKDDGEQVRLYTKSISDVAYVENCYDDVRMPDPKHWEHLFSDKYERHYGNDVERIISKTILIADETAVLSYEDKLLLGKLIAIQYIRVPGFLERQQKAGEKIGVDIAKDVFRKFGKSLSSEKRIAIDRMCLSSAGIRNILLKTSTDVEKIEQYAKVIAGNVMNILYNSTLIPFCTSDSPVIFYNIIKKSFDYGDAGAARTDTIILYPLSPTVMIQVCPRALFNEKDIAIDMKRIVIKENEIGYIMKMNDLQMKHAQRESYFPPEFIELVNRLG